jgi:hypothetical protein
VSCCVDCLWWGSKCRRLGFLACLWMCGVERRRLGLEGAHHQRFEGNKADARCTQPCEGAGGTW